MAVASALSRLVWICWTRISWAVSASARYSEYARIGEGQRADDADDETGHHHRQGEQPEPLRRVHRPLRGSLSPRLGDAEVGCGETGARAAAGGAAAAPPAAAAARRPRLRRSG